MTNFAQIVGDRITNLIAYGSSIEEIHDLIIEELNGDEGLFFLYYKAAEQLLLARESDEWDRQAGELMGYIAHSIANGSFRREK